MSDNTYDSDLDPTEAALLSADIKEWRRQNPGWQDWDLDVRLTRFGLWLAERCGHGDSPSVRAQRERAKRDLLLD